MKVETSRSVQGSTPRRGSTSGSGFAQSLDGAGPAEVSGTRGASSVHAIHGLLALQEVGDSTADERGARRGDEILDRLEELRRGLLLGRIDRAKLDSLAQMTRHAAAETEDPRLREILGDIELRAAVELAKLEIPQG